MWIHKELWGFARFYYIYWIHEELWVFIGNHGNLKGITVFTKNLRDL